MIDTAEREASIGSDHIFSVRCLVYAAYRAFLICSCVHGKFHGRMAAVVVQHVHGQCHGGMIAAHCVHG